MDESAMEAGDGGANRFQTQWRLGRRSFGHFSNAKDLAMRLVGFLRELVPCRHRDQLIRKEGLNLEEALAGVTGACLLRGEISFWGSSAFLCVSRAAAS